MLARYRAFSLCAGENRPEEYEDAFAADPAAGRFAVADGASASVFAGLWARLLVDGFVHHAQGDPHQWQASLSALQAQWDAAVRARPLPWYVEADMDRGAFAAFLGVTLSKRPDGTQYWQALAIGDSCLFHTRGPDLLKAFPLEHSRQFNNFPALLGSRTPPETIWQQRALQAAGTALPHDRLWLMTDAMAHWCLSRHEAAENPWATFQSLLERCEEMAADSKPIGPFLEIQPDSEPQGPIASQESEPLVSWVEQLRRSRELRNDDVTVLTVEIA